MRGELLGNLASEPEFATSASGNNYLQFDVCDRTAGKEKKVYCKVMFFGKRADSVAPFLAKGKPVFVKGQLDARPYTGRDGSPRVALSMLADSVDLVPRDYSEGQQAAVNSAEYDSEGDAGIPF